MTIHRRALATGALGLLAGAAGLSARPGPARAQDDWPARTVTMVVPWSAGGSTDAFARVLAARLSTDLKQPFVVDNRTGASGTVGMASVARAKPDGYTVVVAPNSTYAIAPNLYQLPYDTNRAFTGVGLLAAMPTVMAVPRSSPATSVAEYVALVKRSGGREGWANAGAGSTIHMAAELFQQVAGIEITDVGYRGGGQAIQGVLAGDANMIIMPAAALIPHFQSGDLRPLAVTTRERSPLLPNVPTFAESGFPGFEVVEHIAMLVPAGTPQPVIARLNATCAAALDAPEVRERMAALTVTPGVRPAEEWPSYVAAETGKWRDLVKARNIRLQ